MAESDRVEMQLSTVDKQGNLQIRLIKSLGERTKGNAARGPQIVVSLHPDLMWDRKQDGSMPDLTFRVPQSTKVRVWAKKPARTPKPAAAPEPMFEPLTEDAAGLLAGKSETAEIIPEVQTGQDNLDEFQNNEEDSLPFVPPTVIGHIKVG
jgi:hypothetical protein